MSEFLAEAQVLVTPNTVAFRSALQAQLLAATKGVVVPVEIVPSVSTAALTTGFARLTQVQNQIKNSAAQSAGALAQVDKSAKNATASLLGAGSASAKLDAGLLGLRTALGSTAVIGLGALSLGAIVAGKAISAMVSSAAELEAELNVFRVTARATAFEMQEVSAAARDLGRDASLPGVSAVDAAQALQELSKAGLSVEESIDGARGVLQLATAANIDIALATELAANALNTFALEGGEATHVADLLTGASISAQGSITDMGIALQQSGAAARLAGVSLEDTIALISLLAKNGLAGSDAGTSLRTAFLALASPTKEASKIIDQLNLDLTDLEGNLRADIFAQFFVQTSQLNRLDRLNLAVKVFGRDAVRALGLIGSEGVEGLANMRAETDQAGLAAELAGARTQGFAGDVGKLTSDLETLGTSLGSVVNPALGGFVRSVSLIPQGLNIAIAALIDFNNRGDEIPETLASVNQAIAETQAQIQSFGGPEVAPPALVERLDALFEAFEKLIGPIRDANQGLAETIDRMQKLKLAATDLAVAFPSAAEALDLRIAQAQAGGNRAAEVAALQQREAGLEAFIERLSQREQDRSTVRTLIKANKQLDATRDQIQRILDGRVADQKRAASEAQGAARDAQDARDKQFQAIAESFEGRQAGIEDAISRAGISGNLAREIRLNQTLIESLKKEKAVLLARLKTLKVSNEARKQILSAINQALEDARQDQLRFRQEQRENIQQAVTQRLDLRIQLAEARDDVEAQIRARQAKLAQITKQLAKLKNAHKKNTIAWLELKVAQAQEIAAIKDLQKQNKDEGKDARKQAAEFFFSQLQAQQGFASNLLGNLIPRDQTAGLVGVPAAPTPGRGVAQAAQVAEGKRGGGPTSGQAQTTNDILIRILAQLKELNGDQKNPEAGRQRRSQNSVMDYQNTGGGYGF